MTYKDRWAQHFDDAREAGHDEDAAGRIADERLADDAAARADHAHDLEFPVLIPPAERPGLEHALRQLGLR